MSFAENQISRRILLAAAAAGSMMTASTRAQAQTGEQLFEPGRGAVAFRKYGGRFLVRAGSSENLEGKLRSRHVIIEFKDYDTALACYRSPEYAAAIEKRKGKGEIDLAIVGGYDGVQPG
jgi:uncharacterized protein (DUF1330 family)